MRLAHLSSPQFDIPPPFCLPDVDECLSQQHNCSRGTNCINTGGGFQCVSPECPRSHGNISYVKTSPLWVVTPQPDPYQVQVLSFICLKLSGAGDLWSRITSSMSKQKTGIIFQIAMGTKNTNQTCVTVIGPWQKKSKNEHFKFNFSFNISLWAMGKCDEQFPLFLTIYSKWVLDSLWKWLPDQLMIKRYRTNSLYIICKIGISLLPFIIFSVMCYGIELGESSLLWDHKILYKTWPHVTSFLL